MPTSLRYHVLFLLLIAIGMSGCASQPGFIKNDWSDARQAAVHFAQEQQPDVGFVSLRVGAASPSGVTIDDGAQFEFTTASTERLCIQTRRAMLRVVSTACGRSEKPLSMEERVQSLQRLADAVVGPAEAVAQATAIAAPHLRGEITSVAAYLSTSDLPEIRSARTSALIWRVRFASDGIDVDVYIDSQSSMMLGVHTVDWEEMVTPMPARP